MKVSTFGYQTVAPSDTQNSVIDPERNIQFRKKPVLAR